MLQMLTNRIASPTAACAVGVLSAFLLSACGGTVEPIEEQLDAGVEEPVDSIAPSILSVTPESGTIGVLAGAVIEVTFSEPMNQSAVEGAWISEQLPTEAVAFDWNATGTVLEVTPNELLALASGVGLDPESVARILYSFKFGSGATDPTGNPLSGPVTFEFSTKREMTVELEPIRALTRVWRSDGLVFNEGGVTLTIGDTTGNLQTKTFTSFSTPVLPDGSEVIQATLSGNQNSTRATPYVLGAIEAFHINTDTIDDDAAGEELALVGDYSTSMTTEVKTIDVTSSVLDDIANRAERGGRTQYRLEFPTASNLNNVADEARYSRAGFGLSMVYQVD